MLRLSLRGRRLRRGRLPPDRSSLRHERGHDRTGRRSKAARHPGHARPRRRAHLDRAPVVPGGAARRRTVTARRSLRMGRDRALDRMGRYPSRHSRLGPVSGPPARLVPEELLRRTAGAELRMGRWLRRRALARCRRRSRAAAQHRCTPGDHRLLARSWRGRVPHRHGVLTREGRHAAQQRSGAQRPAVARHPRLARRHLSRGRHRPGRARTTHR